MAAQDPLLAQVLKEIRETRETLLTADENIRESLDALTERVKIQKGRVTRLEVDLAEHRAAQRERFALKHEVWSFVGAFICGGGATLIAILVALH